MYCALLLEYIIPYYKTDYYSVTLSSLLQNIKILCDYELHHNQ